MSNSIGARQVHWHLHVNALAELEALVSSNPRDVDPELLDECRYALFGGIQSARNLIEQEGWNVIMPAYPTTKVKLDNLQVYWGKRHEIPVPDGPSFQYDSLETMLLSTAKIKYLTERLQIHIRFQAA